MQSLHNEITRKLLQNQAGFLSSAHTFCFQSGHWITIWLFSSHKIVFIISSIVQKKGEKIFYHFVSLWISPLNDRRTLLQHSFLNSENNHSHVRVILKFPRTYIHVSTCETSNVRLVI